jgi:hypothetical protein
MISTSNRWYSATTLSLLLILKAVLILIALPSTEIGLAPDEAQYWTWSQHPDWGYYSKPPAIAWQIALGTYFFGNNELGVRFGAFVWGFLIPLAVYRLALAAQCARSTAFWSGLLFALTPLGITLSIFSTTDGGYLLFWTLALASLAETVSEDRPPHYLLLGALVLCGALFKWPIYFLWLVVLPYTPRKDILPFFSGLLLSLLGLIPSLIWNRTHEWATFRHVLVTMQGGNQIANASKAAAQGNFWDFIGAQALLLSPLVFILLLIAFYRLCTSGKRMGSAPFLLGATSLAFLVLYSFLALFQKMQGNWCLYAYPSAMVFLCWFFRRRPFWLPMGAAFGALFTSGAMAIPAIQSHDLFSIPYKFNAFRQCMGWDHLAQALTKAGYDPSTHFLVADRYQTVSLLSFYAPGQQQAYFFNLGKGRKNQFSYWPTMAQEQQGKSGFYVEVINGPQKEQEEDNRVKSVQQQLSRYFNSVNFIEKASLFESNGIIVKSALLFHCEGYNGLEPLPSDHY